MLDFWSAFRDSVPLCAATIKEIADKIEDACRLNNNGQVDNALEQNVDIEIRIEEWNTFEELINNTIDINRR